MKIDDRLALTQTIVVTSPTKVGNQSKVRKSLCFGSSMLGTAAILKAKDD